MRGASLKPLPYDPGDPDGPAPQPPWFRPLMPSGHRALAEDIVRGYAHPAHCPPERLRGLCEAYVLVTGMNAIIRDESDVADAAAQAAVDCAADSAAHQQIGQGGLTTYLRLTQQQREAVEREEELTRLRGAALAEYQRQASKSLRDLVAELRASGYAVTPSGIKWLIDNARPR